MDARHGPLATHPMLGDVPFDEVVNKHTEGLYRFALRLMRTRDAAEDLVQETFVRALERREQFRGDASPGTWLRRVMHHLAVDRARRKREVPLEEVEERWMDDQYTVDSDSVLSTAGDRDALEDALLRLPFAYRSAVVLHDVEGMTAEEIASAQEVGLPAAKQRIRRGRMMLVTALAQGRERKAALEGVPLRCWDARQHVSDYLDGEGSPELRRTLEQHLAVCPTCPPLYASLVGVRATLGGLRDPDSVVTPDLTARIQQRLKG